MFRKIIFGFCILTFFHSASAQDEKMINISFVGGITPGLYNSLISPISLTGQITYNINSNIAAGLFMQSGFGDTDLSFTQFSPFDLAAESDFFSRTEISQLGIAGVYSYGSAGTLIRPYGMLLIGNTTVKQVIRQDTYLFDQLSDAGYDDFSQLFDFSESYLTIGIGVGAEFKILSTFGVTIQVVNYDIFGMIGDEAALISASKDDVFQFDITNGYITTYQPIPTRKYFPLYFNAGVYMKFLKKKI